jgi:hypothetical protein
MADQVEAEGQPAQPVQSVADPDKFVTYLERCVPVLLDDCDGTSASFKAALSDRNNVEQIKKFLSDPQTPTLLVQRSSTKGM